MRNPFHTWADTRLVGAVTSGDKEAIVYFFYEKFWPTFQYHIYNIFSGSMDDQELVDEFFLHLYEDDWRRLRTYDPSKAALSTWVSTVSFRFFRNYKRSRIDLNGLVTINEKWDTLRMDWVQDVDEGFLMDVTVAIDSIANERDRDIARCLLIKDEEYENVAKEFGLSVDYVYTVKNRVLKKIRTNLKGYA
ncbi:MAG: hypothetical protein MJY84_01955 [Bacteroidales bacterium]|nr:hypothetical protein [Bacteroidales bacterium]